MASETTGKHLARIASALERIADVLDGKQVVTASPEAQEVDPPTEDSIDQSEPTRTRERRRRATPLPLPPSESEDAWHSDLSPAPPTPSETPPEAPSKFGRPTMPSKEFNRFGTARTESDSSSKRFGFRLASLSDQDKTKG